MKRFLVISAALAVAIIALWIDFLPVKCDVCGDNVFRTDITSTCFGGHGTVVHLDCCPELIAAQPGELPTRFSIVELEPPDEVGETNAGPFFVTSAGPEISADGTPQERESEVEG